MDERLAGVWRRIRLRGWGVGEVPRHMYGRWEIVADNNVGVHGFLDAANGRFVPMEAIEVADRDDD